MQENASLESESLTRKQERAIEALLSHTTIEEAAKAVNVHSATIFRWLQIDVFREAYMQTRREATRQAIARLQQASSDAVETLREIMQSRDAQASARVSAAKAIIEYAIKATELEDLQWRVEQLELLFGVRNERTNKKG